MSTRLVRLRKKGQITIPEDIRARWALEEGAPLWLSAEDDALTLVTHDPRSSRRVAETATGYAPPGALTAEHAAASALPPASGPRWRDLATLLGAAARLTPQEADAFAADLAALRASTEGIAPVDPWAS